MQQNIFVCEQLMNEVAEEIRRPGKHGSCLLNLIYEAFSLLFADDVSLVSHNVVGLQNQLNTMERASAKTQAKVNMDKIKITILRKGEHLAEHEKMVLKSLTAGGSKFIHISE